MVNFQLRNLPKQISRKLQHLDIWKLYLQKPETMKLPSYVTTSERSTNPLNITLTAIFIIKRLQMPNCHIIVENKHENQISVISATLCESKRTVNIKSSFTQKC